jgi:hypothetical protein
MTMGFQAFNFPCLSQSIYDIVELDLAGERTSVSGDEKIIVVHTRNLDDTS